MLAVNLVIMLADSSGEAATPLLPLIRPNRLGRKSFLISWPSRNILLVGLLCAIAFSLLLYDLSSFFLDRGQAYLADPWGWNETGSDLLTSSGQEKHDAVGLPEAEGSGSSLVSDEPAFSSVDPYLVDLHEMVSSTKGFFVRDYSLGLGWNNVS